MADNEDRNKAYAGCVDHCTDKLSGKEPALTACINGCATVNARTSSVGGLSTAGVNQVQAKVNAEVQKLAKVLNEEIASLEQ